MRSIALLREVFAYHAGLADFAFVMQGLGSGPIALAGSDAQKNDYLKQRGRRRRDRRVRAFRAGRGLRRPGAINTVATAKGDGWVLDGTKTWISNGGIADFYVVFAKGRTKGISRVRRRRRRAGRIRAHRHRRAASDGGR